MSCLLNREMERRRNPRRRTEAKVYLSWPGQAPCRCQVTDLSVTGAFVEVGSLRIPENKVIKLVFVLTFGPLVKMHYLSAIVVHRSEMGLGLKFQ